MSRKGNCRDNAVAESIFKILKSELIYHQLYLNPQYALDHLLHIEITSKQDTSLLHFNSPERCYASFQ